MKVISYKSQSVVVQVIHMLLIYGSISLGWQLFLFTVEVFLLYVTSGSIAGNPVDPQRIFSCRAFHHDIVVYCISDFIFVASGNGYGKNDCCDNR